MGSETLYTPEVLALAVELAGCPQREDLPLHGHARSPTCGSTLVLDLELSEAGKIAKLGMRVRACAIGQAAAAIFARHAPGRSMAEIAAASEQMQAWLAGEGPVADWPDLALIAAARDYPARHGAMLLPWRAALAALSSGAVTR